MDKTWTDIAGTFAQAGLTTIGTVLGGPLGGAIGGVLGQAAAAALGVEQTPEAVTAEIERDPVGAALKLQAVESKAIALAEIDLRQVAEVNATMRAELASELTGGPFRGGWRPFCGWALGGLSAAYGSAVVAVAARVAWGAMGAVEALTVLLNGVGPFTLFLTPLGAVAGVTAWTRGQEKAAARSLPGAVLGKVAGSMAGAAVRKAVR